MHTVGLGIAVVAVSMVVNLVVSLGDSRRAARAHRLRRPWPGTPRICGTDALTSAAVLVGLVLVDVTGAQWIDPVVALAVAAGDRHHRACGCSLHSSRVLVDEALPPTEVEAIRGGDRGLRPAAAWSATTSCARGGAGARRYVDLHVQFRGRDLARGRPSAAHELQDMIAGRLRRAPTC